MSLRRPKFRVIKGGKASPPDFAPRRKPWSRRFLILVSKALILTALTMGIWMYTVRHSGQKVQVETTCKVGYVYDGDTIAMTCNGRPDVTARLMGFDTAETKNPGCAEELAHGALATDRLRQLVKRGEITITRMGRDKYNRPLIRLDIDGQDVADTMIREGLAVAYHGGKRVNWCERLGAVR